MNETIGQLLQKARSEKMYSLETVSHETNVLVEWLHALEQDQHEKFPSMSMALGFLRLYGELLDLDTNRLADLYVKQVEKKLTFQKQAGRSGITESHQDGEAPSFWKSSPDDDERPTSSSRASLSRHVSLRHKLSSASKQKISLFFLSLLFLVLLFLGFSFGMRFIVTEHLWAIDEQDRLNLMLSEGDHVRIEREGQSLAFFELDSFDSQTVSFFFLGRSSKVSYGQEENFDWNNDGLEDFLLVFEKPSLEESKIQVHFELFTPDERALNAATWTQRSRFLAGLHLPVDPLPLDFRPSGQALMHLTDIQTVSLRFRAENRTFFRYALDGVLYESFLVPGQVISVELDTSLVFWIFDPGAIVILTSDEQEHVLEQESLFEIYQAVWILEEKQSYGLYILPLESFNGQE